MAALQYHPDVPMIPQSSSSPLPPYNQPAQLIGEWAIRISSLHGPLQAQFYHTRTGRSLALVNRAYVHHGHPQQRLQPAWDLVDMAFDQGINQDSAQAFPGAPWILIDQANVRFANPAEESDLPIRLEKLSLSSTVGLMNSPYQANGPLTPPADLPDLRAVHSIDVAGVPPQSTPSPGVSAPPPLYRSTTQPRPPATTANVSHSISRRPVGGAPARKLAPAPSAGSLPPHQSPSPVAMAPPPHIMPHVTPISLHMQPQQQNYTYHATHALNTSPGVSATLLPTVRQQPQTAYIEQQYTPQACASATPPPQHQQNQQMPELTQAQRNANDYVMQKAAAPQAPYLPPLPQRPNPVPVQQIVAPAQPHAPYHQAMHGQPLHSVPNKLYTQHPATQVRTAPGGHQAGVPHAQKRPEQQHTPLAAAVGPTQPNAHLGAQQPSKTVPQVTTTIPGYGTYQPSSTFSKRESISQGFGKMKKLMKHPAMKSPAAKYAMKLGTGLVIGGILGAGAEGLGDAFSGGDSGGDFSGGGDDATFVTEETVTIETDTVDVSGGGEEVTYTEVDTTFVETDTSGYGGMDATSEVTTTTEVDTSYVAGDTVVTDSVTVETSTFTEVDQGYGYVDQSYGYTATDSVVYDNGSVSGALADQQQVAMSNEAVDASAAQLGMEYRGRENALALI